MELKTWPGNLQKLEKKNSENSSKEQSKSSSLCGGLREVVALYKIYQNDSKVSILSIWLLPAKLRILNYSVFDV